MATLPGPQEAAEICPVARLGGGLALPQSSLGVGEQVLMKIFTNFFT